MQCQKYSLSEAPFQLEPCPQGSQGLYTAHHCDIVGETVNSFDAFDRAFDSQLDAFDRAIGEVVEGMFPPLFCLVNLETSNGLMPSAGELMMLSRLLNYCAWCRECNADHWGTFVLARAEAQRVNCAARESYNKRTSNCPKHSTCSHM